MTDKPHSSIPIRSLLKECDNLLTDSWELIEPDVPCRIEDGVFICQAAPDGVAVIDSPGDKVAAGYEQRVELDQTTPNVVVARVEGRCEDLRFSRVFDYALAVRLLDADDGTIAESFTPFADPGDEWQAAEVRIVPLRPAKAAIVRLVCLCQEGCGQFRNPACVQLPGEHVSIDGIALPAGTKLAEGWYVSDVTDETQLVPAGSAETLGLAFSPKAEPRGEDLHVEATVTDTTGRDRALSVLYVHPLADGDWRWLANMREDRPTEAPGEYLYTAQILAGRGLLSRWPLAGVASGADGRAIALDMTLPAVYRVGYSAGLNALFIAFDIALAAEQPKATFAADVFGFDGTWGFRGAIQRMYELQPEAFADRTGGHGLWGAVPGDHGH